MRKKQRTIISMVLACMMVFVPAAQVMASAAYDVSESDSQVLFPGDELTGIGEDTVLIKDGEEITAEYGSWKNTSEEKAYIAKTEDDSVTLTAAGYVLTVMNGSSETADGEDGSKDNHYSFTDEEKASLEEEKVTEDIAYYKSGETVRITAENADEGYEFAGWSSDTDEVSFADVSDPETTFVMPDRDVLITATYQEEAEPGTEAAEEEPEVISEEPEEAAEEPEEAAAEQEEASAEEPSGSEIIIDITDITAEEPAESSGPEEEPEDSTFDESWIVQDEEESIFKETADPDEGLFDIVVSDTYGDNSDIKVSDDIQVIASSEPEPEPEPETYTVSVFADGDPEGDDYEESEFEAGTEVEITVTAADLTPERKQFSQWDVSSESGEEIELSDDCDTSEAETVLKFTMPEENVIITAVYIDIPYYSITVEYGSLVSGDSEYAAGEEVEIVTAADLTSERMQFSQWDVISESGEEIELSDDCDTSEAETVLKFTMPEGNVIITAVYIDIPYYSIIVEYGSLVSGDSEYAAGTKVTVTVTASGLDGYRFKEWSISGAAEFDGDTDKAAQAELTFIMPESDVVITANYNKLYNLTVIDGETDYAQYIAGELVYVVADVPESGMEFSGWEVSEGDIQTSDLADSMASSTTFIMPESDVTLKATYVPKETETESETETEAEKYTVTVNKGKADPEECEAGTTVTVTADAAETGWKFDHWNADTANVSLKDSGSSVTTFTMPASNVTLTAVYSQVKYTVTVENGTADQNSYNYGDTVTLASNYPASGKEFSAWTSSDSSVTFADASRASTTFTMPAGNVSVAATYKDGPSVYDNYISGIEEGGAYVQDEKLTFTAVGAGMSNTNPNPGDYRYVPVSYQIGNVSNTWSESPYTTTMSIKKTGEYNLKVTFEKQVWNGNAWVADGTTDVRTVTFNIITPEEAVSTGDNTPIYIVAVIAGVALLVVIVLLIVFFLRRRKQSQE